MADLDLKTRLFLFFTGLDVVKPLYGKINIVDSKMTNVYVFENYESYLRYLNFYLEKIDENKINNAIMSKLKTGQIVVWKKVCDSMIIMERTKMFYDSYNQTIIDEIHARGKITALEKVEEYEQNNVCAPGEEGTVRDRCKFFSNCHDCLLEYATHYSEYDKSEETKGKKLKKYK